MGSLCTTYACQIGARSNLIMTDIKLSIFSLSEVSGTYRTDFASMIIKDGRQNPSAVIKVPQDSIIRCFFLVSLGSAFIKNSTLAPYVSRISEKMAKVVSKEMKQDFMAKFGELKKAWKIPN